MREKAIESEADYDASLLRIDDLMGAAPGTPDGEELEALVILVETYEAARWPIAESDKTCAITRSE